MKKTLSICLALLLAGLGSCGGGDDGGGGGGQLQQSDVSNVVNTLNTSVAEAMTQMLAIPFFAAPTASASKAVISCLSPQNIDLVECSCSVSEAATICDARVDAPRVCTESGVRGWSGTLHAEGTQVSGAVNGQFEFHWGDAGGPCFEEANTGIAGQLNATISGLTTDVSSEFDFSLTGSLAAVVLSPSISQTCDVELHISESGITGTICGITWPPTTTF